MAALDGMRVLDMTQYEAGTSCTQALAWLGADVVKIEAPEYGDPGRGVGRSANKDYSAYFCAWNANKRSVALDLRTSEGRDLLLRMAPNFDVFVENYGPGVIERLDIGYDVLRAANPGLIYARIKGFGTSGPYADFRCMDMVAQAAAGAFSITGEADGPPMMPGPTTGDSGTGVQAAMAILAAYVQKQRTGEGQEIELSMQEAMAYYVRTRAFIGSAWGTRATPRSGNAGGLPPVNIYACKPFGPNDYIYLMPVNQGHWDGLCAAMDRGDLLIDPRFATTQKAHAKRRGAVYGDQQLDRGAHQVRGDGNDRCRRRALCGLSRHGGTAPRQAPDLPRLRPPSGSTRARRGTHARVRPPDVGVRRAHGPTAATRRTHRRGARRRVGP